MKNVLIISTSIRNGSNSEILAKKFLDGALESKHNVEFITLKNKEIKYCLGCLSCQKTKKCIIKYDEEECCCHRFCYSCLFLRNVWSNEDFIRPN